MKLFVFTFYDETESAWMNNEYMEAVVADNEEEAKTYLVVLKKYDKCRIYEINQKGSLFSLNSQDHEEYHSHLEFHIDEEKDE